MELYKRVICSQCEGKGKVYTVGYVARDCVLCEKKGYIFQHVDPLSLPPLPHKEAVSISKRGRGRPKGSLKKELPTFREFVRGSTKKEEDK